jgi:4-diphosphocytidyl-2-C-methyl-D-erythritol kinase
VDMEYKSHAKINLTLEVLSKRRDGYHEIRTVFQELELHDTISFEVIAGGGLELTCSDSSLPGGEENLAYKAALLLKSLYAPDKGIRMHLTKRIPIAAGLGGGSSNAAAVLKALNRLWKLSLNDTILLELGARLGSDVPFFLYGGTALAEGRGEILKPLPDFPQTGVLLTSPKGLKLSAAEVYGSLKLDRIGERKLDATGKFVQLLNENRGLGNDLFDDFLKLLCNDLEFPVFDLQDDVFLLKKKLLQNGITALVSGSGPTIFALSRDEELLQEMGKRLIENDCRVINTKTTCKKKDIIEEYTKGGDH